MFRLATNNKSFTRMHLTAGAAVLLAFGAAGQQQGQDPMFDLVELGSLGSGETVATAVNDEGQVVGWSQIDGPVSATRAFFWENDGMTDLGTLGGDWSAAFDINNAGMIVGASTVDEGEVRAFYAFEGELFDLNSVRILRPYPVSLRLDASILQLPLPVFNEANAINEDGVIVGRGTLLNESDRAFKLVPTLIFDPDNPSYYYIDLGTLPHADGSAAYGVNEFGDVVGVSGMAAFMFDRDDDRARYLDPFWRDNEAAALSVNDFGEAVGWSAPVGSFHENACLWKDGYRIDLGAGVQFTSRAFSINNEGYIVGSASRIGQHPVVEQEAILWMGYELPVRLFEVTNFGPSEKKLWDGFDVANAISKNGHIVGCGRKVSGRTVAILLVPRFN